MMAYNIAVLYYQDCFSLKLQGFTGVAGAQIRFLYDSARCVSDISFPNVRDIFLDDL